jgi:enoyl-CoA hydratase
MPIHYEQDADHIVLITIDRPERRNALDFDHFRMLRESWDRFEADDDAWAAIVTGVGESFFSGADLRDCMPKVVEAHHDSKREGSESGLDDPRWADLSGACLLRSKITKPIIAAVNGPATAGGMELLTLGCDIRVACPEASFAAMEPKRGLLAGGGTGTMLPRMLPWAQAMEILLCADLIPADRAYDMGFLNAVVPREQVLDKAYEFARRILSNAPLAVRAAKKIARESLRMTEEDSYAFEWALSQQIFSSEDAREGPKAFAEKRPPKWAGR